MSKHVESSFSQPIHYVMHNVFSTMTSTSMKFYTEVALLNTTTHTGIALIISFFHDFVHIVCEMHYAYFP